MPSELCAMSPEKHDQRRCIQPAEARNPVDCFPKAAVERMFPSRLGGRCHARYQFKEGPLLQRRFL